MKKNKLKKMLELSNRISIFNTIFEDYICNHPYLNKNYEEKKILHNVLDILKNCQKNILVKQYSETDKISKNGKKFQPISKIILRRREEPKDRRVDGYS